MFEILVVRTNWTLWVHVAGIGNWVCLVEYITKGILTLWYPVVPEWEISVSWFFNRTKVKIYIVFT